MGMNSDDFVGSLVHPRKSRRGMVSCGIIASKASGIFNNFFWLRRHAQVSLQYHVSFPARFNEWRGIVMAVSTSIKVETRTNLKLLLE